MKKQGRAVTWRKSEYTYFNTSFKQLMRAMSFVFVLGPLKNGQLHSNVIVGLLLTSCPKQPKTRAATNLSTPK